MKSTSQCPQSLPFNFFGSTSLWIIQGTTIPRGLLDKNQRWKRASDLLWWCPIRRSIWQIHIWAHGLLCHHFPSIGFYFPWLGLEHPSSACHSLIRVVRDSIAIVQGRKKEEPTGCSHKFEQLFAPSDSDTIPTYLLLEPRILAVEAEPTILRIQWCFLINLGKHFF